MSQPPTLMSYSYLLDTSMAAEADTDRRLNGFANRFPRAIDCLLKLPHWGGWDPTVTTTVFRGWAASAYITTGYTFAAMYKLYRGGFYLEAAIIQRNLFEILVQLAYFTRHPDRAENHFIPRVYREVPLSNIARPAGAPMPKGSPVAWKTMFDDIAPGYYATWYAMASRFAHGSIGADLFRIDHRDDPVVSHGCHYDESDAGYISNQANALMYGFLSRFSEVFADWDAEAGSAVRSEAMTSIGEMLRSQWDEHPQSHDWLRIVAKLILWSVPTEG